MLLLEQLDVELIRAGNPSPMTLSGTNTWLVGRDPVWVIDPGPSLAEHLEAVGEGIERRGGAAGILLTHHHADHSAGTDDLIAALERPPAMVAGGGPGRRGLAAGDCFGDLEAYPLPGHSAEHYGFLLRRGDLLACFTGDAVLGEGSVFVGDDMAAYLKALRALQALSPAILCPGHGPVVTEVHAHLETYVERRLAREEQLLDGLARGMTSESELLAHAWRTVPTALRRAAVKTLRAHLRKLEAEGRLPGAVEADSGID